MKTILKTSLGVDSCYLCGTEQGLEVHHVFFGSDKTASDENGFMVKLCSEHHRGTKSPHKDRKVDLFFKELFQKLYEEVYSMEEFMDLIGRNYL